MSQPVDLPRLARACELLEEHRAAGRKEKWLSILGKLADLGWLNEPSVADACLGAPLLWLEEARLVYTAQMRGGQVYVLGPGGEEWADVVPLVRDALAEFGGAEVVQLRHARAWLALRWRQDKAQQQTMEVIP